MASRDAPQMSSASPPAGGWVTRFAPSPTGYLHLGVARTALFNDLLAHSGGNQGSLTVRIEDSDRERSERSYEDEILRSLEWLGLYWEGFTRLSDHDAEHRERCLQLADKGQAYWCDCTAEELEEQRRIQMSQKAPPAYSRRCRERGLKEAKGRTLRFKVPLSQSMQFRDELRGDISVESDTLSDFVLMRSDGSFTYQLCVVVQDNASGINLVARGEDLLPSTPRQILLYEAFGWEIPRFAHLPLVNGTDGQRLSKRHGAESVLALREQGYLPAAVVNQLVRLGWSYGDQEIFDLSELRQVFSLKNVGRSAATFDPKRLTGLNKEHMRRMPPQALLSHIRGETCGEVLRGLDDAALIEAIPLGLRQANTLHHLSATLSQLIAGPDPTSIAPKTKEEADRISVALVCLERLDPEQWKEAVSLAAQIQLAVEELSCSFSALGKPLRRCLLGTESGPPIDMVLHFLGREEGLGRIKQALLQPPAQD